MFRSLFVFKRFVIQFVQSLSLDEREAFRHWCIGIIPDSKLDVDLTLNGEVFKLIEFLCNICTLSFTDFSLLKDFLSTVGRCDLLEALERVELRISVGSIVEDYIKSVNGYRRGGHKKLASGYMDIVEFLAATRQGNLELLSPNREMLREVNVNNKILQNLDILNSQLSWSKVVSSLVIMGDLYAAFSSIGSTESGYYVSLFSETRASECLTVWMLENGGLVSNPTSLNTIKVLYGLS